jgi:hypothetical protein
MQRLQLVGAPVNVRRALTVAARFGLGALLLIAGALKLRDPSGFAVEISNYRLLPALASYLAALLPAIEVVLGVALLASPRRWRQGAALGTLGLFAAFTVAVGSAYFRAINISCGCFGSGGDPITGLTLARNLCLLAAAGLLLAGERNPQNFTRLKSASNDGPSS